MMDNIEEIKTTTDEWTLLEKGRDFLRKKGIYTEVDKCWRFYLGNQWHGLETGNIIGKIVYNIIKPIVKYKVGVVNSNEYGIVFTPNNYDKLEFQKELEDLCENLNKYTAQVLENQKIIHKCKKIVKQACITSEGILYFDYDQDKKEVVAEVVSKNNIYYGNENDSDIQNQPYILITFRRTPMEVRKEAEENANAGLNKLKKADLDLIIGDDETHEQAGDYAKDEVDSMVTCVLKMWKENGTVWIKKSTRHVVYEEARDTGLTLYPVAHLVWEDEEGSARGVGEVLHNIPNQIEINKTAMRRAIAVAMTAYPKLAALMDKITNKKSLTEIGTVIQVEGETVEDIHKIVGYLNPAAMSSDSEKLQSELIINTRELAGAGDIVTGNINPEQASGRAILAVQQAAREPLNEQVYKFKDFMEDIGRILIDMWKAFSENGKNILVENELGETELYNIPQSTLENMNLNIKIDITPKTPYDKYAQEMSIENLTQSPLFMNDQWLEDYISLLDDDSVMPKAKLEELLQSRQERKEAIGLMQQVVNEADSMLQGTLQQELGNVQAIDNAMVGDMNAMQGM